jgi:hypothetical protein
MTKNTQKNTYITKYTQKVYIITHTKTDIDKKMIHSKTHQKKSIWQKTHKKQDLCKAEYVRDVEPGELIVIDKHTVNLGTFTSLRLPAKFGVSQ